VKLGKNASDTCLIFSEAYGGEAMKMSSVFEWRKQFKDGRENVENVDITNEDNSHHFLRCQGHCSL